VNLSNFGAAKDTCVSLSIELKRSHILVSSGAVGRNEVLQGTNVDLLARFENECNRVSRVQCGLLRIFRREWDIDLMQARPDKLVSQTLQGLTCIDHEFRRHSLGGL
jgi:hypothetical protein